MNITIPTTTKTAKIIPEVAPGDKPEEDEVLEVPMNNDIIFGNIIILNYTLSISCCLSLFIYQYIVL